MITIDGKDYQRDFIVFPDHIVEGWWREEGHLLKAGDIEQVLAYRPDVLVVGQGTFGRMRVADEVRSVLRERNIELIADRTDAAKDAFNRVAGEGKRVVAAFHLTC